MCMGQWGRSPQNKYILKSTRSLLRTVDMVDMDMVGMEDMDMVTVDMNLLNITVSVNCEL